jgi:hypothetical protein
MTGSPQTKPQPDLTSDLQPQSEEVDHEPAGSRSSGNFGQLHPPPMTLEERA